MAKLLPSRHSFRVSKSNVSSVLRVSSAKVPRRSLGLVCRSTAAFVQVKPEVIEFLVPADDLRKSVQLQLVNEGRGQAVVVEYVSQGSAAAQVGLKPGQKLRGILDPIRSDQMYDLGDRPSLKFVMDAIRMSRHSSVRLQVEEPEEELITATSTASPPPVQTALAPTEPSASGDMQRAASVMAALDTLTGASTASDLTIAQQLEQRLAEMQAEGTAPFGDNGEVILYLGGSPAPAEEQPLPAANALDSLVAAQTFGTEGVKPVNEVQARIKRRADYLDQVSQRNDAPFFSWLFGAFIVPPAIILALAFSSGYMDTLYAHTLH